jgi:hypothetical protein
MMTIKKLADGEIIASNNPYDSTNGQNDNPTVFITAAEAVLSNNIPQYMSSRNGVKREPLSINTGGYKNVSQTTMPMSPNSSAFNMACNIPLPPSPMSLSPALDSDKSFSMSTGELEDAMAIL